MTLREILTSFESLIPAVIGGTMGLLAIIGLRELFRETKLAFKKGIGA